MAGLQVRSNNNGSKKFREKIMNEIFKKNSRNKKFTRGNPGKKYTAKKSSSNNFF